MIPKNRSWLILQNLRLHQKLDNDPEDKLNSIVSKASTKPLVPNTVKGDTIIRDGDVFIKGEVKKNDTPKTGTAHSKSTHDHNLYQVKELEDNLKIKMSNDKENNPERRISYQ